MISAAAAPASATVSAARCAPGSAPNLLEPRLVRLSAGIAAALLARYFLAAQLHGESRSAATQTGRPIPGPFLRPQPARRTALGERVAQKFRRKRRHSAL